MRVLVTGLSTLWGGRVAQRLEQDPSVETVIGIDRRPPKVALERTEFVEVSGAHSLIERIVRAAEIDTVIDTRLVVDPTVTTERRAHENNVIGTMNILAACSGADSPVRRLVVKSTATVYGAEQDDPAFFTEDMTRRHPPRTRLERDLVEAEEAVLDFARSEPAVRVALLRFAPVLGPSMNTALTRLLALPLVPTILGFEPRLQVLHEEDLVGILTFAARQGVAGVFNGAADGVLSLGEVLELLGKHPLPVLPPWGTGLAAAALSRSTGVRLPPELLSLLRFGRGMDNRRLKAAGYRLHATSRETVDEFGRALRAGPVARDTAESFRYERTVEDFLRYSPSVRHQGQGRTLRNRAPGAGPAELPPGDG